MMRRARPTRIVLRPGRQLPYAIYSGDQLLRLCKTGQDCLRYIERHLPSDRADALMRAIEESA